MNRFLLTAVVLAVACTTSEAGIFRSARRPNCAGGYSLPTTTYYTTGQGSCYAPPQYAPQATPQYAPVQTDAPQTMQASPVAVQYVADDGNGAFVNWLNGVRASRGLRAVVWSPVLAADAVANSARGFGHSFMGRARRQNAGWGRSLPTIQQMWLASPAHADAIFDPTVTEVGLGMSGDVVTLNLR